MNSTNPEPNEPAHLGSDIHCVSLAIRRALDTAIAARVSPELTGARGMVLGYIAHRTGQGEPVYQRDIEERFHIRRSSVTALLKAMEQDGFVTRTSVARDARLKSLALTPKGQACYQGIRTCIADFEDSLHAGLTPEQLAGLTGALRCLLHNAAAIQTAPGAANLTRKDP